MIKKSNWLVFILILSYTTLCWTTDLGPVSRNSTWAVPLKLDGVPNFHKVSGGLYRSAQPTRDGMKQLKKFGIKTVINLRSFHSDRDDIKGTGLKSISIPMKAWHPDDNEIIQFLKIVSNPENSPVLVHCQQGSDRTGTICAVYRVVIQGWSKEEAIKEMTQGGYGYHTLWKNLPPFIKDLDLSELKKKLRETKS